MKFLRSLFAIDRFNVACWILMALGMAGFVSAEVLFGAGKPVAVARQAGALPDPFIWAFHGRDGHPAAVRTALKTGLFSHVAIFAGYANDPNSDTIWTDNVRETIHIAKQHGASLILFRLFFPPGTATVDHLTDSDFMAARIRLLRAEADRLGIEFIGFEMEAWNSLLADYMNGSTFTAPDFDLLTQAVQRATNQEGFVDYVTPAGRAARKVNGKNVMEWHPYGALRNAGFRRICQQTYFDRPSVLDSITADHEVAGLFLSVRKENWEAVDKRYFTAVDVLDRRREVWQGKGVFVWPKAKEDMETAWQFAVTETGR